VKVLLLSYGFPPTRGGVEVYTYEVARQLAGWAEDLIVVVPRSGTDGREGEYGFRLIQVPGVAVIREFAMFFVALWYALRSRADVVVNAVWLPCGVVALPVSRLAGIPYIVVTHGSDLLDQQNAGEGIKHAVRRRLTWLRRIVLRSASAVVSVSNYTRGLALRAGADPANATTVPNGVDQTRFRVRERSDVLARAYGLTGARVLLTVARLDYHKGHADVLRALPRVAAQVPNVVHVIVGTGPLRQRLEELSRELGVEERVRFVGAVDEARLVDLYNLSDLFVLVPHETEKDVEGFGLVFLEASACGLPVVGGDSGGVREAIVDGVTGILVRPGDVEDVADALVTILRDRDLARRLGVAGRERVEREFNWGSTGARLWGILKEVTGRGHRSGERDVRHLRHSRIQ
jgi:phosphatidylinositol alpha-1,6-mannosyltransferase